MQLLFRLLLKMNNDLTAAKIGIPIVGPDIETISSGSGSDDSDEYQTPSERTNVKFPPSAISSR